MFLVWVIIIAFILLYGIYLASKNRNAQQIQQLQNYLINGTNNVIEESILLHNVHIDNILNSYGEKLAKDNHFYEGNEECPICMEKIDATTNIYNISCGHLFHKECLTATLKNNCICPICRIKIEKQ